jgi:type II secretory pathway pseudopilin PulG
VGAVVARKGFALVAAILAVVLIAALVAGVLFATTEETRASTVAGDREVALDACDAAIAMAITEPGVLLPDSIGVGGMIASRAGGHGPEVIVYITRLDSALYSILAESVRAPGSVGSAHRIGVVVRSSIATDHSIVIYPISERPWFEVF